MRTISLTLLLGVLLCCATVAAQEADSPATDEASEPDPATMLSLSELMATSRPLVVPPPPLHRTLPPIHKQMRRFVGRLKRCYENSLKGRPGLSGKVVIAWEITEAGRVRDARVVESELGAPDLEACLVRTIARWRFTVEVDEPVKVRQVFVFVDQGHANQASKPTPCGRPERASRSKLRGTGSCF